MNHVNNSLAEALAAIIKPIVKEAVEEAMNVRFNQPVLTDKSFLTIKQAADASGLGASTIRLLIRRHQLKAQRVGRHVLVKRTDLESFLESAPVQAVRP